MNRMLELCGKTGMANYGGMWRNRWRRDQTKCERILATLESDLGEGKEIRSVGGFMADLWKRWP